MARGRGNGAEPAQAVRPRNWSRRAVLRCPNVFLVLGVVLSVGVCLVFGAGVATIALMFLNPGEAAALFRRFWLGSAVALGIALAVGLWIPRAFGEDDDAHTWQETVVLTTLQAGSVGALFVGILAELAAPLLALLGPYL
ncbi:hypothetical protein [Streptomonospora salina]|uniref:Uncharacterized protein n=1 Tax=Streptomonospora salina TaxID=104205 RepID=A0A841E9G6_9ACTN|nr:hypothetical protein [Streptomonospora salina]MBB5999765.1 hypothetical protein [Streptomonospora salina]